MRRKSKPPKPVRKAAKAQAKYQLADLRRRLEKIASDRKPQAKVEAKNNRGRPVKAKPKPKIEPEPKPKERKMPRHRRTETGEVVEVADPLAADEPTKVYVFHLNLVTPPVEATDTQPAIPEIVEQQAEGVRWSDRTYTIHWTATAPAVGYLTFPSLRHLTDTYPKLTVAWVDGVEPTPTDDEAIELEAKAKEAEEAELAAKAARALAEEAKARVEARHAAHA
jgi:hypothetical protein